MQKPYLIIALGPTGSGKGCLPEKVLSTIGYTRAPDQIDILIDNLVEQNDSYKKMVSDAISGKTEEEIKEMFVNPSDDSIKEFSNYYFKSRGTTPCLRINKTCNDLNDLIFFDALSKKNNIVYESVGTYWPEWLFEQYNKLHKINSPEYQIFKDYYVVVAWSVVNSCELIKRNKSRAIKSVTDYIKDKSNPAPRLPDIIPENYKNQLNMIINVYKAQVHLTQTLPIRFLVFDNNETNSSVLYDSATHKDGIAALDGYKPDLVNQCAGRKKQSRKRTHKKQSRKRTHKKQSRKRTRKTKNKKC